MSKCYMWPYGAVGDPQPWRLGTTTVLENPLWLVLFCDPCPFVRIAVCSARVTRTEDHSDHDGFVYALVLHYPSATSVADPGEFASL
jgi:hypothetical protein